VNFQALASRFCRALRISTGSASAVRSGSTWLCTTCRAGGRQFVENLPGDGADIGVFDAQRVAGYAGQLLQFVDQSPMRRLARRRLVR
jgi:hypothetical protein